MKLKEKSNIHFALDVAIFMVFLYGTTIFVHLNGDDFMYGSFAHNGILRNVWSYYHTGNGRFWVNILDSTLLWFDRYLYIIITPWVELAFVWLIAKNVQYILAGRTDKTQEHVLVRICIVLFACLDVLCLRETVFWITGMMNYLFPAVLFLLAYYLFQKSRQGELHGWKLAAYYVICFFAASSVEQFALMFVGIMTLCHIHDLFVKKQIHCRQLIVYFGSIIALATLICAPGNFVRVDAQAKIMPSFIDNLWTLVYQNTFSTVAFPFIAILSTLATRIIYSFGNRRIFVFSVIINCIMIITQIVPQLEKAVLFLLLMLVFIAQMIYVYIHSNAKMWLPLLALSFVGLGSQIMLLISVIWGFRCMFSMYMVYMLLIACLLYKMEMRDCLIVLGTGITAALHPILTLILWGVLFIGYSWKQKQPSLKFLSVTVRLCTVVSLLTMCLGYGLNFTTYQDNIKSTLESSDVITIKAVPYEIYSWYSTPFSEFHENYYRIYYGLDSQIIIYDLPEDIQ